MIDIPEAEYIAFEHGPFDYDQENRSVEEKIEEAMATFDFSGTDYCFDTSLGRIITFILIRRGISNTSDLYERDKHKNIIKHP